MVDVSNWILCLPFLVLVYHVAMVLEAWADGHTLLVFVLYLALAIMQFVVTAEFMATMSPNCTLDWPALN